MGELLGFKMKALHRPLYKVSFHLGVLKKVWTSDRGNSRPQLSQASPAMPLVFMHSPTILVNRCRKVAEGLLKSQESEAFAKSRKHTKLLMIVEKKSTGTAMNV